jgi:hypothetical protein
MQTGFNTSMMEIRFGSLYLRNPKMYHLIQAQHLTLPWQISIQHTPSSYAVKFLQLRAGIPNGLLLWGLSTTAINTYLVSLMSCYMRRPSHLSWFHHSNWKKGQTFLRDLLQGCVSPYDVGPSVVNMLLSYIINERSFSFTVVLLNLQIGVARDILARRELFYVMNILKLDSPCKKRVWTNTISHWHAPFSLGSFSYQVT